MKLPTLYTRTSSGAVQEWTVEVNGSQYRTHHGQVGGKIVTTAWFDCVATNAGRANERDPDAQAMFEAKSTWSKKVKGGAFEDISKIDEETFIEPMLAKKWEDRESKVKFPVYCQPKLDGMRAVISKKGAFSRNGKPWLTIPHILAQLAPLFEQYPDLVLDGELYTHALKHDFNKISSLIKKTKPTAEDLAESAATVEFWWYDIAVPKKGFTFTERNQLITEISQGNASYSPSVVVVPTYVAADKDHLDSYYGKFMDDGYEGQMIRLNSEYVFKRSDTLLKRKEFQDDEYTIIQICEGNGNKSGMAGYAWMQREDGVKFRTNIKGNFDFLKDLLVNAEQYAGTVGTVKYFNLTPDGIPRFPYLIKLRSGKSED
jgi:DNA ligase-1